MPNHITNIIEDVPAIIAAFLKPYTHEEISKLIQEADERVVRLTGWSNNPHEHNEYIRQHVDTWLEAAEKELDELIKTPPTHHFTFSALVPEPENLEAGGCGHDFTGIPAGQPEDDGTVCWYKWNLAFWGTKWNMYDAHIVKTQRGLVRLTFNTAWSTPMPIFEALGKRFPTFDNTVLFADENLGHNCGSINIEDGTCHRHDVDSAAYAAVVKYGPRHDIEELTEEEVNEAVTLAQYESTIDLADEGTPLTITELLEMAGR